MSRWLAYTSAGVLLSAGVVCFLAASTEWGDRIAMVDPDPAEAAEQAGFVLLICAIGAVNLVAGLAVLFLRRQVVWWLIVGLQSAVVLVALAEGVLTDPPGWFAFSTLPLTTLLLLVALRFVEAKLRPSVGQVAS